MIPSIELLIKVAEEKAIDKERKRILGIIGCEHRFCMDCQYFDYLNDADTSGPAVGYCQIRNNRRHDNEAD